MRHSRVLSVAKLTDGQQQQQQQPAKVGDNNGALRLRS